MRTLLLSIMWVTYAIAVASATEFEPPARLEADGVSVRVESPGYAAPCWADIDGDGKKDLLVGQKGGGRFEFTRTSATANSQAASG